jgi:hypothetical protein
VPTIIDTDGPGGREARVFDSTAILAISPRRPASSSARRTIVPSCCLGFSSSRRAPGRSRANPNSKIPVLVDRSGLRQSATGNGQACRPRRDAATRRRENVATTQNLRLLSQLGGRQGNSQQGYSLASVATMVHCNPALGMIQHENCHNGPAVPFRWYVNPRGKTITSMPSGVHPLLMKEDLNRVG